MENNRSKGITIFGIYFIVCSALSLITTIFSLNKYGGILTFYNLFVALILLILGINILQLKEWARKGIICYQIFNTLFYVNFPQRLHTNLGEIKIIMGVWIITTTVVIIYFFTRPKVKEQFK